MKTEIKNYSNYLKRRSKESWHVFFNFLKDFWKKFVHKGHEKMVIMLIPHDEKKIVSFHISKFTIGFFVFLFFIVIATSSFAVISNSKIKSEEEKLLTNYKDVRSQLLRYEKLSYEISDMVDSIKPEIEEIYEMSAGSDEAKKIWESGEEETVVNKDQKTVQKTPIETDPAEIKEFKRLQKDILTATNTIKTVKNFVDVRSKVIYDTPSSIPNSGHITSLFGWRRSPFGFGKDFHTGIDIAAPEGTPIHATAPGVVTMTGWSGGYGNMIRIQHKYGFITYYAHCSKIIVNVGDNLKKGQLIGYVGQTGASTGNHCHYEVRLGDVPINPYPYMSRTW